MDTLVDLIDHQEWGDAALWRAVLTSEEARRDPAVTKWLHHIHLVQHAFVQVWRGERVAVPEEAEFAEPEALAAWGEQGHAEIRAFMTTADEPILQRHFKAPWAKRYGLTDECRAGEPTVSQSVIQLSMHSVHHRAQIAARLRETGHQPPPIDFIIWLWSGRPAPEWPRRAASDA